jgi:hypothetical protein
MVGAIFMPLALVVIAMAEARCVPLWCGHPIGIGVAMSSFGIVMAALGRIVPPEKRSWPLHRNRLRLLGPVLFALLGGA